MRYKLFIFLICLTITACNSDFNDKSKRNENWVWWVDAKTGKSEWVSVNYHNNPVKNGRYTKFYSTGNIYCQGKLQDGMDVDTTFYYDSKNRLEEYDIHSDTIEFNFYKNGPIKQLYQNGDIKSQGVVNNHKIGNSWKKYYENGKYEFIVNTPSGIGWITNYYENGIVKDSIYQDLKGRFTLRQYYENGQLSQSDEYKNGDFNGPTKRYFPSGRLKSVYPEVNAKINGKAVYYYEDGKVNGITYYTNGVINGPAILYYENGQIQSNSLVKNGKLDGEGKAFNEAGKLIKDAIYKNGSVVKVLVNLK